MIPAKQVQEILDASRIEEVVEEFVALRRRGTNFIGLCPFHGEKTPSFNVNPARNVFKCFGCGKGGDAVTFLREHEKMNFSEALHWLARKYNIKVEEVQRTPEQLAEQQHTDSLYIVNEFAQKCYSDSLFGSDEGKSVALNYFKTRGLREETIRSFGLGYAPENPRDWLIQKAKTSGYSLDLLKKLGLTSHAGDRDFFRARVMFPIHSLSGKVAAFAGRTMSSDKTIPKYINSPETEVYVKNKILFGVFQAKKAIRQHDECILTEGYMDVISLHQAGIENVVASSGTSLTEGQLQLIKRNTDNLKILYDGDPAGIKAALRGLDLALEQDLNVKIALLPPGEDPDSYVQKIGSEAFKEFARTRAKDFILFKTELLLDETKGDPIKRSGLVKDIVASIARIPDPIKRNVYVKECAALMGLGEEMLLAETNKLITTALRKKQEKDARAGSAASDSPDYGPPPPEFPSHFPGDFPAGFPTDEPGHFPAELPVFRSAEKPTARGDEYQERDIIRLLVQFGHRILEAEKITVAEYVLADIEESLGNFDNPLYGKMAQEAYDRLVSGQQFEADFFFKHEHPNISELAFSLATEPWEFSPNWEARHSLPLQNQPMPEFNFDHDTKYSLRVFKVKKLGKLLDSLTQKGRLAAEQSNFDEMFRLMKIQQKVQETLRDIEKSIGKVVR